jgi:hypothetical protein
VTTWQPASSPTTKRPDCSRVLASIRDVFVRRGLLPNPQRKNKRAGVCFHDIHNRVAARKTARTPVTGGGK